MRCPRVLFTTRGMMITVALVGLNLAGAIATSKYYPRKYILQVSSTSRGRLYTTMLDGSVIEEEWNPRVGVPPGSRPRVVQPPNPPPTLLRIWTPVIAAATITLLILMGASRRPTTWHRADPSGAAATGS